MNETIASGGATQMILTQEAMMEKQIGDIAEEISRRKDVRFIMIAGPSSSGKTTFSHRLSTQLLACGTVSYTHLDVYKRQLASYVMVLNSALAVVGQHTGGGVIHVAALPLPVGHPEIQDHPALPRIVFLKYLTIEQ